MILGPVANRWMCTIPGDVPCVVAARRIVRDRLGAVARQLRSTDDDPSDPEAVHQLRVATRRSAAALCVFRPWCGEAPYRALCRRLRLIREAASSARRLDVHRTLLCGDGEAGVFPDPGVFEFTLSRLARARADAEPAIRALARRRSRRDFERLTSALLRPARPLPTKNGRRCRDATESDSSGSPYVLAELAASEWPRIVERVQTAEATDLNDLANVHRLRLAGKKLRYGLEVFSRCVPESLDLNEIYRGIVEWQDEAGRINDQQELLAYLESLVEDAGNVPARGRRSKSPRRPTRDLVHVARLAEHHRTRLEQCHRRFLENWKSPTNERLLSTLHSLTPDRRGLIRAAALEGPGAHAARADSNGHGVGHRRVAAIDVGTNSIRLVVAETDPLTHFRIIEDLKETTRLGAGVYTTGRLQIHAVKRSIEALRRMKSQADRYRVERLRAVGTSALRESANGAKFVKLVRRRTGLNIETIDAEREGRLALSSVAHAFDLVGQSVAIADVGGGSTEIVLTRDGVVEAVCPTPLGAVRLTELHAEPTDGKYRFGEMCRAIDEVLASCLRRPRTVPELIIGTGGTFTSLARVAIRRGHAPNASGLLPFAVRGYELSYHQVVELLDWLRRMPADERSVVPGLSSQRAEIIVAGVCIVERLLAYLGADRLRVHDGGIRDGLLAEMIDELGLTWAPRERSARDLREAARQFAQRCEYDQAHGEHVRTLALRVFDQLAERAGDVAGWWARPGYRDLLEAAAVVHDVGLLIGWRRHHRHGYDMITHADLPGMTPREVELVANVARYHRGPAPRQKHRQFRHLGDDDQRVVAHLAGILRVADGLDRLHTQNVADVVVVATSGHVRFEVVAENSPQTNLRYAQRKADVFETAFRARTQFVWVPRREPVEQEPVTV